MIAALAATTMINTLITWHRRTPVPGAPGIVAGAVGCGAALTAANRAVAGTAVPHIPLGSAAALVAGIVVVTYVPIMVTFRMVRRR